MSDESHSSHESGGIDTMGLDELPRPESGAGEMLVAVKGAAVGPWDRLVREGQSGLGQTLPLTLGSEISAMVAMLGADVGVFALGDAVYGATNDQFDGEYALVEVARKPAALDYVTAAGVPVVAVYRVADAVRAHQYRTGTGGPGARCFGQFGTFATQMAKAAGLACTGSRAPGTSNGRDGTANVHFGDRLGSRAITHIGRNTI
jgi:NADPH:quinone reductase-like Zn-dependent oxidoreductase